MGYQDELCDEVVETTSTKADGAFLWAPLVIDELKGKLPFEVRDTLGILPRGLPQLYARMLMEIDEGRRPVLATILRWVVGSMRPLTVAEMGDVLRRQTHQYDYIYDASDVTVVTMHIIESCGHLWSAEISGLLIPRRYGVHSGNQPVQD